MFAYGSTHNRFMRVTFLFQLSMSLKRKNNNCRYFLTNNKNWMCHKSYTVLCLFLFPDIILVRFKRLSSVFVIFYNMYIMCSYKAFYFTLKLNIRCSKKNWSKHHCFFLRFFRQWTWCKKSICHIAHRKWAYSQIKNMWACNSWNS